MSDKRCDCRVIAKMMGRTYEYVHAVMCLQAWRR
jgi:hypothetical protein